ncbi:MAG TPA: hypothetical protein VLV50_05715 [Stellaceae bacterium]|nr:hypothetical protein [Stellaceae bacterium]
MKAARVLPVFSAAYAVIYLVAMYENLALATYYPRLRQWFALTVTDLPKSAGPAMYWYGWIATAAIGGAVVALLALALPERPLARFMAVASWAAPLGAVLVIAFLLRGWFLA